MNLHYSARAQKSGLTAAGRRLTEIALLMREVFPTLHWERERSYRPHRNTLDVAWGGRHVVVPFTDRELHSHSRVLRVLALDHRMYAAMEKLLET